MYSTTVTLSLNREKASPGSIYEIQCNRRMPSRWVTSTSITAVIADSQSEAALPWIKITANTSYFCPPLIYRPGHVRMQERTQLLAHPVSNAKCELNRSVQNVQLF